MWGRAALAARQLCVRDRGVAEARAVPRALPHARGQEDAERHGHDGGAHAHGLRGRRGAGAARLGVREAQRDDLQREDDERRRGLGEVEGVDADAPAAQLDRLRDEGAPPPHDEQVRERDKNLDPRLRDRALAHLHDGHDRDAAPQQ